MAQLKLLDYCFQLLTDVVGCFQVAMVQVVLETPVDILILAGIFEKCCHESYVVSVLGYEFCMGIGGLN